MKILLTTFVLNLLMLSNLMGEWEKCNLQNDGGQIVSISNHGERIAYIMHERFIYLSEDSGDNWKQIPFGIKFTEMTCIGINQNTIFLVADSTLYVSSNLGKSWVLHLEGVVPKFWRTVFCYNDSIYVLTKKGLAKSFDNGKSWTWQVFSFQPGNFCKSEKLMIVSSGSKLIYSLDDGTTWIDAYYPPEFKGAIAMNIIGDKVFAGGSTGLISSDDKLQTWRIYDKEIPYYPHFYQPDIWDIKVVKNRIYIAFRITNGVFYSDNFGENWTSVGGRFYPEISNIAATSNRLFITGFKATDIGIRFYDFEKKQWFRNGSFKSSLHSCNEIGDYIFCSTGYGLMYSKNKGMDWAFFEFDRYVHDVLIIDSAIYTAYVPYSFEGFPIDIDSLGHHRGVMKSTDFGATWKSLNTDIPLSVRTLTFSNGTLFASAGKSLYRSEDLANNWELVEQFGPWNPINSVDVIGNTILVGYEDISISHDFGESWQNLKINQPTYGFMTTRIANKIFIRYSVIRERNISDEVIGISYDNGKTFDLDYRRDNVPFINNNNSNISFDYVDDKTIFSDDGENWYDIETGLVSPARFITTKNDYFIVQTMDGDLYRIEIEKLKQLTHVESQDKQAKLAIFPNPASEYIEISSPFINPTVNRGVDEGSDVKIFNILSECVMTQKIHPMTRSQRMNVDHLPVGVYYLRIGSRTQVFVKV